MVRNKAVENYWYKHYVYNGHCSLCGNHGIIDTRKVKTPAGSNAGRKNFCICPNGQTLREHFERNLPKDGSLLVTNAKRLQEKQCNIKS